MESRRPKKWRATSRRPQTSRRSWTRRRWTLPKGNEVRRATDDRWYGEPPLSGSSSWSVAVPDRSCLTGHRQRLRARSTKRIGSHGAYGGASSFVTRWLAPIVDAARHRRVLALRAFPSRGDGYELSMSKLGQKPSVSPSTVPDDHKSPDDSQPDPNESLPPGAPKRKANSSDGRSEPYEEAPTGPGRHGDS